MKKVIYYAPVSDQTPPSRLRHALHVSAILLAVVVLTEGLGWLGLAVVSGPGLAPGALQGNVTGEQPAVEQPPSDDIIATMLGDQVIHPYVGLAFPISQRQNVRTHGEEQIEDYGFPAPSGPLVRERRPDTVVVGLVGGSVARHFINYGGHEVLKAELQKHPAFQGKNIVVSSTALYAFKEPQQLLSIAYLLSLGAKFDIIVALDGFNEATIAQVRNIPQGQSPFYPAGWTFAVDQTDPDPKFVLGKAKILTLEGRRSTIAWLKESLLGWSRFVTFALTAYDRRLASAISWEHYALESTGSQTQEQQMARGPVPTYDTTDAYMRDQVGVWEDGTRQLARLSAANGIRFYGFLQPNQYAGKKTLTPDEQSRAWRDEPYKPLVEAGYPLLRAAGQRLRAEGIAFEDLSPMFDHVTETIYTDDCCHMNNTLANSLMAVKIAQAITASWGPVR